jgi:hypothetical protein
MHMPYVTATTIPPVANYSNRYIDPFHTVVPTSVIIPSGPSRIVETHFNASADNGFPGRDIPQLHAKKGERFIFGGDVSVSQSNKTRKNALFG